MYARSNNPELMMYVNQHIVTAMSHPLIICIGKLDSLQGYMYMYMHMIHTTQWSCLDDIKCKHLTPGRQYPKALATKFTSSLSYTHYSRPLTSFAYANTLPFAYASHSSHIQSHVNRDQMLGDIVHW